MSEAVNQEGDLGGVNATIGQQDLNKKGVFRELLTTVEGNKIRVEIVVGLARAAGNIDWMLLKNPGNHARREV